ncbi:holo-ACP synthase [Virgibacillus sp. W0181]|uniref:holo-ACP synthase n=1 Tax=Virgibacillus sp. W0181 TaxID=3391581 RepID=UPI003F485010
MIIGIGLDIIELDRIKRLSHRTDRFAHRILSGRELSLFTKLQNNKRKTEFLAGRFAAKEAFAKATGRGIGKLSFQHIEVLRKTTGAPMIQAQRYETKKIFVSITHSKEYAAAQVIIEEN